MVKVQRKPSGNTNVGSNSHRPGTTGGVGISFSRPIKLNVRHNIFSDTGPDPTNREVVHRAPISKESATWVIRKNDEMKYTTENVEKFEDPMRKNAKVPIKSESLETSRVRMRANAADKFFKLAKSRYGGAEDLFKAFNKGKSDSIDLDEFSEMFRKRSLDLYFPRDEQRLLFEQFDTHHSSSIGVSDVISQYSHASPNIITTERISEQKQKERNEKIISKIFLEREKQKLLVSPRQTTLQIARSLRNLDPHSTGFISKEELRWGLGKEYLNIALSDEEIDAVVELCPPDKHNGKISYDKFARMLDIRNDDPVVEPFFDARANQVTRMKNRIDTFDKAILDEKMLARREHLMKVCHGDAQDRGGRNGSFDIHGQGGLSTLNKTVSCPELELSQSPVRGKKQHRHEEARPRHDDEGHAPYAHSDNSSHFRTGMKLRGKGGNQHQNSMDLTEGEHPSSPVALMPGGKRLFHYAKFDEELLQHNMSSSANSWHDQRSAPGTPAHNNYLSQSMSVSASQAATDDDRFNTTSSSYFAPLLYRPSVPVTRPNVVGDSMRGAVERDERRRRRFQRTANNLQNFADFKELEDISAAMNDHMRCKGRALEALNYESIAIHNDAKKFLKQQVVTMQRKPNKALYDKMWGGDVEQSRKEVGRSDDRDFNTTYNGSFVMGRGDEAASL